MDGTLSRAAGEGAPRGNGPGCDAPFGPCHEDERCEPCKAAAARPAGAARWPRYELEEDEDGRVVLVKRTVVRDDYDLPPEAPDELRALYREILAEQADARRAGEAYAEEAQYHWDRR